MTWLRRHPGEQLLNRFADGELGERDHAAAAAHLAGCTRCREEVALVRRLGELTRALPGPMATDEILRRALARRSAGERVLLPMSDAGAPRRPRARRLAPLAMAAMLTLMVAGLVLSVRVLQADRPALHIHPERPAAGEALQVEYRGGSLFADHSHLALRGRYRTADDRHWQLLSGILVRGEDGLYRTEVQLPDSVVYAAFAVEDLYGDRLDSNNRELWDVMVHDRDGKPTLEAMTARLRDLERRDWGEAYELALAMTDAFPDEPQAWAIRFAYELSLFDRDSVFTAHRAQFERLEQLLTPSAKADPAQLAWLAIYAVDLENLGAAEGLLRAAREIAPGDRAVIDAEVIAQIVSNAASPERRLAAMERLWARSDGGARTIGHGGWQAAVELRDAAAINRWSRRYLEFRPHEELTLVPAAFVAPELRPRLVRQLTTFLDRPESWHRTERPLWLPIEAHLRQASEEFQQVLSATALAASTSNDPETARVLADLGVDLGWNSQALLQFGEVLARGGFFDRASGALAKAAADPGIGIDPEGLAWLQHTTDDWAQELEEARRGLLSYVMEGSIVRPLGERERSLLSGTGGSEAGGHEPRVIAFLSRYCAPALDETARLPQLADRISALGGRLVVINIDNTPDLIPYLRAKGYDGDVLSDPYGDLRSAFRSTRTADFFVVDSSGRIRFEHSPIEEVARQVWALRLSYDAGSPVTE